jgi:hypothetical protein
LRYRPNILTDDRTLPHCVLATLSMAALFDDTCGSFANHAHARQAATEASLG